MKSPLSLLVVFSFILLSSCHRDGTTPSPAPVITAFTPSGGKAGDTVAITGSYFSQQLSGNTVKFSDTAATVITATGSKLNVIVPNGAPTGKISVTVNGKTAVSADSFVVSIPSATTPVIVGFTPESGQWGELVTITGTGFDATATNNLVRFNGVATSLTSASTTQLVARVPRAATTGRITVKVGGLTATAATDFTAIPTPVVSSFSPASGVQGDTVIITGTGFSTVANDNIVMFYQKVTATVISATATQLTVTIPAGAITGTISVTIGSKTSTSATGITLFQDIPRNGLVAFYPLNGNANDSSGNGFNLTLAGTYSPVADRFGAPGRAYYFNGGSSYAIAASSTDAQVTQPVTIAAWVKYDSLISSSIVSKYSSSLSGYKFGLGGNATSGNMMAYFDGGTSASSSGGSMPGNTNGKWMLIAMTYDGFTVQFFQNGGPMGGGTTLGSSITATANSNLRIGLSGDGGTGAAAFKCSIDDVTIYNRVLSAAEIQQLYAQTISKR